ncbi:hypothetical protein GCM10020331_094700 [Ectobacillus funiculus]
MFYVAFLTLKESVLNNKMDAMIAMTPFIMNETSAPNICHNQPVSKEAGNRPIPVIIA